MSLYNLEVLSDKITSCQSCSLRSVDCPVPGSGQKSPFMLIFEYPSADEALLGRPLEERSGLILKKIMQEEKFDYNNYYMTFTLKCKTNNPQQSKDYLNVCKKWLWEEIKLIEPKTIITFGMIPSKLLLKGNYKFKLKDVVGEIQKPPHLEGIDVIPWYSPSLFNNMSSLIFKTHQFIRKIKEIYNV